jgi:hypothetical protein
MLPRTLTALLVLALFTAPAPVQAQSPRYDGGRFSVELPRGIARLPLVRTAERPMHYVEMYVGGDPVAGVVMVVRSVPLGARTDPILDDSAAVRRLLSDTSRTRAEQYLQGPVDTSAATRRLFNEILNDTSLASRRTDLQSAWAMFSLSNNWIRVEGDGREIVTEDRVSRRFPLTVVLGAGPPLRGIADFSLTRQAPLEMWMVVYAAPEGTPAMEAAAARLLDSFRLTPVPAPASPRE